jgi:hypothetical protein
MIEMIALSNLLQRRHGAVTAGSHATEGAIGRMILVMVLTAVFSGEACGI